MKCKLRHPIVVYTPTEARVAHELTPMHQLARQLTTDAYLRGEESNLYCFAS